MGFLIDTSVLIAGERERISLSELVSTIGEQPIAISAVTASELLHGVHRARNPEIAQKRRQFVEFVLDLFPIVPFDLSIAREHARLWATLQDEGQIIGAHDLLIAATALHLGYGIVTLNANEFKRVTGLTVIEPLQK